ncbi:Hypothetical protein A7982_03151 [Minicystis rosea]|nr:Hypothetical protein A7982_03151 [Minicystis rosea]
MLASVPSIARSLFLVPLAAAACLALGCGTTVVGGNSGGAGGETSHGAGGTLEIPGDEPPQSTTGGGPATLTHQCSGWGGACSSAPHPEDESCFACSCRCCNDATLIEQCLADAACVAWLDCLRGCEGGKPCGDACGFPCDTGKEPGCYLLDCHNWICEHACGQAP